MDGPGRGSAHFMRSIPMAGALRILLLAALAAGCSARGAARFHLDHRAPERPQVDAPGGPEWPSAGAGGEPSLFLEVGEPQIAAARQGRVEIALPFEARGAGSIVEPAIEWREPGGAFTLAKGKGAAPAAAGTRARGGREVRFTIPEPARDPVSVRITLRGPGGKAA